MTIEELLQLAKNQVGPPSFPDQPIRYGTRAPGDGVREMLGQSALPNVPRETFPQPSLISRLRDRLFSGGPIPNNEMPVNGSRNYASRNALHMFVQGLNSNPRMVGEHGEYGVRGAAGGGANSLAYQRYLDSHGNMVADNERQDKRDKYREDRDKISDDRWEKTFAALLANRSGINEDRDASRGLRQQGLDITVRGQDLNNARGWANIGLRDEGLGLSRERLALAQKREARQGRVSAAMAKWPPFMLHDYQTARQQAFTQFKDDPELRDQLLDQINADFEQRDRTLNNPQPFSGKDQYGNDINDVVKGRSSTATPRGAAPAKKPNILQQILGGVGQKSQKPSDDPNISEAARAYYRSKGQ